MTRAPLSPGTSTVPAPQGGVAQPGPLCRMAVVRVLQVPACHWAAGDLDPPRTYWNGRQLSEKEHPPPFPFQHCPPPPRPCFLMVRNVVDTNFLLPRPVAGGNTCSDVDLEWE